MADETKLRKALFSLRVEGKDTVAAELSDQLIEMSKDEQIRYFEKFLADWKRLRGDSEQAETDRHVLIGIAEKLLQMARRGELPNSAPVMH